MLSKLFKPKNRYFLVFFVCQSNKGEAKGSVSFAHPHFVNQESLIEHLKEKLDWLEPTNFVFTGINELSKMDYLYWNHENKKQENDRAHIIK